MPFIVSSDDDHILLFSLVVTVEPFSYKKAKFGDLRET